MDTIKDTILYEDTELIVCIKPAGIASQDERGMQPALTDRLRQHLAKQNKQKGVPYLGVIHRLDKPVGGVMVYAKTKSAASALSRQIAEHQIKKRYFAVLCSPPRQSSAVLTDYLFYDKKKNCSLICDASYPEAKKAELSYQVIDQILFQQENQAVSWNLALADILLKTGRHHQIRVQFSHIGCPLYGDLKYSDPASFLSLRTYSGIGLYSYCLEFFHPKTKKAMRFSHLPAGEIWNLFPALSAADPLFSSLS
ncbi:MAG: RluA family pseudouridine synthase [Lachnospiraceae bacterium]|nr:RluA family pseudouridine synthase [Lachnospiraceae bacterium]